MARTRARRRLRAFVILLAAAILATPATPPTFGLTNGGPYGTLVLHPEWSAIAHGNGITATTDGVLVWGAHRPTYDGVDRPLWVSIGHDAHRVAGFGSFGVAVAGPLGYSVVATQARSDGWVRSVLAPSGEGASGWKLITLTPTGRVHQLVDLTNLAALLAPNALGATAYTLPVGYVRDTVILDDFYVTVVAISPAGIRVARVGLDGTAAPYGNDGRATFEHPVADAMIMRAHVASDVYGQILVAYQVAPGGDVVVLRLGPDGSPVFGPLSVPVPPHPLGYPPHLLDVGFDDAATRLVFPHALISLHANGATGDTVLLPVPTHGEGENILPSMSIFRARFAPDGTTIAFVSTMLQSTFAERIQRDGSSNCYPEARDCWHDWAGSIAHLSFDSHGGFWTLSDDETLNDARVWYFQPDGTMGPYVDDEDQLSERLPDAGGSFDPRSGGLLAWSTLLVLVGVALTRLGTAKRAHHPV